MSQSPVRRPIFTGRGFNGAATFPSRMSDVLNVAARHVFALQWGRDVSVADVPLTPIEWEPTKKLQWGRDVSVADVPDIETARVILAVLQWGRDVSVADVLKM